MAGLRALIATSEAICGLGALGTEAFAPIVFDLPRFSGVAGGKMAPHLPHCLLDDLSGRGFICLAIGGGKVGLWELLEVPEGVRMRATFDLDPLVRRRLRNLGPLHDEATMQDCIKLIQNAKLS